MAPPRRTVGRLQQLGLVCVALGGAMLVAACDSPAAAPNPGTTAGSVVTSTSQPTSDPTSVVATSTTASPSTTTSVIDPGPLEFVDGKLLGISQGSLLAEATEAFGVAPVSLVDNEFDPPIFACTGTPDPWVIRSGGLTFVFEGSSIETAVLTNWRYTGGPVGGFTEVVAPFDLRIGDPRSKLDAANPGFTDYGGEIDVAEPFSLRYGVENDVVTWFGIVDCVFEGEPAD